VDVCGVARDGHLADIVFRVLMSYIILQLPIKSFLKSTQIVCFIQKSKKPLNLKDPLYTMYIYIYIYLFRNKNSFVIKFM